MIDVKQRLLLDEQFLDDMTPTWPAFYKSITIKKQK